MRIFKLHNLRRFKQNYRVIHFTQMINRMMIFLFINFHPKGRAGGFHLLRLSAFGGLLRTRNSRGLTSAELMIEDSRVASVNSNEDGNFFLSQTRARPAFSEAKVS